LGLVKTLKRAVPLKWKEAAHANKSLPRDAAARARNFLKGDPPIPPGELIYLVAAHRNPAWFLRGGGTAAEAIRGTLARHGLELSRMGAVLDFGCGVGRIMRHWRRVRGPRFHGTDYNPRLVEWCRKHLGFAEFEVNTLDGGLPYESESFDLVYAFSVFTHFSESLQLFWIGEMARVLKPGGHLYFTAHGEHYLDRLDAGERESFLAGRLVVKDAGLAGSNICAAYHPEAYVRGEMTRGFEVVDFVPEGARGDSYHDVYLLRKLGG
jgi:SAM-dependent methyltransferase